MLHIITNATVYSPDARGRQNLLIAHGKILALSDQDFDISSAVPQSTLNADGLWLTPGFIDGHAHITGGGGEAGYASRVPTPELSAYTTAGVTSVIGLLGTDAITRSPESLVAQTYALRNEGLSAWCYTGNYHVPPTTITGSVKRDIVFIDPILGLGEVAISDHRSSQPTFEEFIRLASDCHVAGLMTGKAGLIHVHMGDGERQFDLIARALSETELPARTFQPTHINRNPNLLSAVPELCTRGVPMDITAFPDTDLGTGVSAADALIQCLDAGCPKDRLTISSDGGGCLPNFDDHGCVTHMGVGTPDTLPATLKALLNKGLTPEEALPHMTRTVAHLLRLKGKGEIAPGMDADMILMTPTGDIHSVMVRGVWHVQNGVPVVKGTFEQL